MLNMDEFVQSKHRKMLSRKVFVIDESNHSRLLFHDVNVQQMRYYELILDYPLYPQDI